MMRLVDEIIMKKGDRIRYKKPQARPVIGSGLLLLIVVASLQLDTLVECAGSSDAQRNMEKQSQDGPRFSQPSPSHGSQQSPNSQPTNSGNNNPFTNNLENRPPNNNNRYQQAASPHENQPRPMINNQQDQPGAGPQPNQQSRPSATRQGQVEDENSGNRNILNTGSEGAAQDNGFFGAVRNAYNEGKDTMMKMDNSTDTHSLRDGDKVKSRRIDGTTTRKPEFFIKMDQAEIRGREASKTNHGSYGTDMHPDDVKSETGKLEKLHQFLVRSQESFRNGVQKVDDRVSSWIHHIIN